MCATRSPSDHTLELPRVFEEQQSFLGLFSGAVSARKILEVKHEGTLENAFCRTAPRIVGGDWSPSTCLRASDVY